MNGDRAFEIMIGLRRAPGIMASGLIRGISPNIW